MSSAAVTPDDRAKLRFNYYGRILRPNLNTATSRVPDPGQNTDPANQAINAGSKHRPASVQEVDDLLAKSLRNPGKVAEGAWLRLADLPRENLRLPLRPSSCRSKRPTPMCVNSKVRCQSAKPRPAVPPTSSPRPKQGFRQHAFVVDAPLPQQRQTADSGRTALPHGYQSARLAERIAKIEDACWRPKSAPATVERRMHVERARKSEPALGSMHDRSRGTELEPGPCSYATESQVTKRASSAHSFLSSWAVQGCLREDLNLSTCGMYNASGPYTCWTSDLMREQPKAPICKFAQQEIGRLSDGLPVQCHEQARFAHLKAQPRGIDKEDVTPLWDSWSQTKHVPGALKLDRFSNRESFNFPGAWKNGVELVLVRGSDAGPLKHSKITQKKPLMRDDLGVRALRRRRMNGTGILAEWNRSPELVETSKNKAWCPARRTRSAGHRH
eukprot:TRINITY_DN104986_c0_g1_i1.p1 TRINITY_DN104986_c0_g1~~TRINITY_DN104986_c0_g1_i1.p1  ORF type:complete len:443 (-),score=49.84 TRINITY_DN104986_c0_g1_i1:429-1757(-)